MSIYFEKACIAYGNPLVWIYGDVGYETADTEYEQVERHDQVAANGARASYYVGERRFIDRTFRWQPDARMEQWRTFFRNHGGRGKAFWYYDDAPPIYGAAGNFGAGLNYGGTSVGVLVYLENTEFRPEREDVDGYWMIQITMRRTV